MGKRRMGGTEPGPIERTQGGCAGDRAADRALFRRLALLILALTALRLALGAYPLWDDEYATLIFADQPLSRLWSGWMVRETNPPLFYTLTKLWIALGLTGTLALRLLPILCGAAELALLGLAARLGWGRRAAVSAVLLAGLSANHIYASQLLRGYILATDGMLLSLVGLLLVVRGERAGLGAALYATGATVAIHCHTTLFLWPPSAMAGLLLARPQLLGRSGRADLLRLALANVAILLASAWWIAVTLAQLQRGPSTIAWILPLTPREYGDLWLRSTMLINQLYRIERIPVLIMAAAALTGAVRGWRDPATRLVVGAGLSGSLLIGLVSLYQPIATLMSLLWISALVVLLIAAGIAATRSPERAGVVRLALAALLAFNVYTGGTRLTEHDLGAALRSAAAQPGAALLVEHRTMGAVIARACRHTFAPAPCPLRLVTLVQPGEAPTWAEPQPGVVYAGPERLAAALQGSRAVYALRTLELDPLLHLGLRPASSRRAWNDPLIEGPLTPGQFAGARYAPPMNPYLNPNPVS